MPIYSIIHWQSFIDNHSLAIIDWQLLVGQLARPIVQRTMAGQIPEDEIRSDPDKRRADWLVQIAVTARTKKHLLCLLDWA